MFNDTYIIILLSDNLIIQSSFIGQFVLWKWKSLSRVWLCDPLFEKLLSCFPVTTPLYIPTSKAWGFQLLHILVNTCCFPFFSNSNSVSMCEVLTHCGFDLHFSDD